MKYLYRFENEEEKDTRGRGNWPWLMTKMDLLIVGDTMLFTGPTKKDLKRVRRVVNKVSKSTGQRYTFGRYIETPIMGLVKGMIGKRKVGSEWQIEGRVTSQITYEGGK